MKNLKIALFICMLTGSGLQLMAQDSTESKFKFYGFIRNELYYDSYKGVDAAMDQFYLMPLYTGKDAKGKHYNEQGSAHLTAVATRMGVNINGPEVFGAKTMGNIEVDFAGITTEDPVVIRIRKAFYKFSWENTSLLIGQTWHPFWGGSNFPTVAGLNTGAPFQPFNRSPQIDYTMKFGKLSFSGIALYENQYVSKGFYTVTNTNNRTLPKRNAILPEMVLSANYNTEKLAIGVAAQLNAIKPIDRTTGTAGTFVSAELNSSMAAMAFIRYKGEKLSVLVKTVNGQNLGNLTMLGGYGVKSIDSATGAYTYTNYNHSTSFINIVYGKKYQAGLFAGYTINLGTSDALALSSVGTTITTGMLPNIQNMTRIAPHFAYNVNQFRFIAEYEMTSAAYGTGAMDLTNGLYGLTENVTNNRIIFVMMFLF